MASNPYSTPYQHQTWNHFFFDRIREVQLEVHLLRAYLQQEESARIGGAGLKREISALSWVSSLLFDGRRGEVDMENTLRPVDALWLLALADSLLGSFGLFRGIPSEMENHAVALKEFFLSQCQELDPYSLRSSDVEG